jgi:hypothetical protein
MKNNVSNMNLPARHAGHDERVPLRSSSNESAVHNIQISGPVDYQETYYDEAAEINFYDCNGPSGSVIEKGEARKQRR